MKKLTFAVAVVATAFLAAIGGAVALRAWSGGGSGSALAASQDQSDIFSSIAANQDTTQTNETPWLGAQVVGTSDGLTVSSVIADSPADKAGLARGDVITAVDGAQVSDMMELLSAIENKKPGDSLTLSITRNGNAQDITVTLEARPAPLAEANPLLPELNGIATDQLYSHMLGGSFQFTDKDNNSHTASVDLGTISAVDANAKTVTIDLNVGGSKTYTISDSVVTAPQDLSQFQSGDQVTVVSVDGSLRAISKGGGGMFPFLGLGKGGRGWQGGGDGLGVPGRGSGNGFDTSERAAGPGL